MVEREEVDEEKEEEEKEDDDDEGEEGGLREVTPSLGFLSAAEELGLADSLAICEVVVTPLYLTDRLSD